MSNNPVTKEIDFRIGRSELESWNIEHSLYSLEMIVRVVLIFLMLECEWNILRTSMVSEVIL